ncbi:uncharacterized protein OCT59_002911 [Rhizophagus irregularis]|uniref:uncharacterized protein n=1 Tax=Rhizophagus irregularis TaxID=588596 RepID=UPI0033337C82|nr:hypothetical protein OCT59_002911 [Rhizophagus irregularis]
MMTKIVSIRKGIEGTQCHKFDVRDVVDGKHLILFIMEPDILGVAQSSTENYFVDMHHLRAQHEQFCEN